MSDLIANPRRRSASRPKPLHTGFLCAIAAFALVLTGCNGSGDDDKAEPGGSETAPLQPGTSSDGNDTQLPDDFPQDIPLPEGGVLEQANSIYGQGWQLTFNIGAGDTDDYMQQYAQQLEAAGIQVDGAAGGGISATSSEFDIGVSIDPPELFLQVTKQMD